MFVFRNKRFDFNDSPDYWYQNSAVKTHFLNSLSLPIPPGEGFFISVVKEILPLLEEGKLKEQAKIFISQEASHSREHNHYNNYFATKGYSCKKTIDYWEKRFSQYKKKSLRKQLALVVIIEQYTLYSAIWLLKNGLGNEVNSSAQFCLWHQIEEVEHRALSSDLYHYLYSTANRRLDGIVPIFFAIHILLSMICNMFSFLKKDKMLFKHSTWRDLVFCFGRDGVIRYFIQGLWVYLKKDYNPEYDPLAKEVWDGCKNYQ